MNLIEILNSRYSTKAFDPTKKISDEDFEKVKALLRMSPSSTNIQPWHFIIANTEEGKQRVAKGAVGFYKYNEKKLLDASHVVVFCTRTSVDQDYMKHISAQEEKDGRYPTEEVKQKVFDVRNLFADIHKYDLKDVNHWMDKQVYISMGFLLLGVGALGIDAVPMEGIGLKELDEEFGLREKGYTALAAVSLGYRAENDFNAKAPKSRLPESEVFTLV